MMKNLELWLGIKREKDGFFEVSFFNVKTQTKELKEWIKNADNENFKIEYLQSNYEEIINNKDLPIEWYIQVQQNWDKIIKDFVENSGVYKMSDFNNIFKNKTPIEVVDLIRKDRRFSVHDEYFRIVNNYFIESIPKHLFMERIKNDIENAIDKFVKIENDEEM